MEKNNKISSFLAGFLGVLVSFVIFNSITKEVGKIFSPLADLSPVKSVYGKNHRYEVFGFAPYWNFGKLDNIDFNVLTTLAYFDLPVDSEGNIVKDSPGYQTFQSRRATELFQKAHDHGTRVVLTLTQMDNSDIEALMDNEEGQESLIEESVDLVKKRGIDGINVDFEYIGDPGEEYRRRFSNFVSKLTKRIKEEIPEGKVTVSVYASAVKEPKIYDISTLSKDSDGIFMMAYDFATTASDSAIPTAPLYGHKEGKYWYDVSTAVDDFLTQMPRNKLILGVPYYGYNYLVNKPEVKADTIYSWYARPTAQTYSSAQDNIRPENNEIQNVINGWDPVGQVGWKAYFDPASYIWRMIFLEDKKSLAIKYDFAKGKNLGGVGIWALGFDDGKQELWDLLREKFGLKLSENKIFKKIINENI